MTTEPEPMAYVAIAPCGCTKFAGVDTPERAKTNAKEIAACVREGYRVERVTCDWVRKNFRNECAGCKPAEQEAMEL